MGKFIDMTGWVMKEHGVPESRWTIVEQAEDRIDSRGRHHRCWLCECSCEERNKKIVPERSLNRGESKSCGCLNKEKIAEQGHKNKKYNKWIDKVFTDERGSYRIGLTSNTNKEFYVDIEDFDVVKDYCWFEHHPSRSCPSFTTLVANIPGSSKKVTKMHILLGCKWYDHADGNELNNRRYNLRPATHQENMRNIRLQKNNSSGVTGISIHKQTGKWRARIMVDYKEINLGLFDNKEDAIKARLQAEIKYFGEFAPQQHLFEEYGIIPQNDCEVTE